MMSNVGFLASQAAVLLMTIKRSIVISKPLTWNAILPRKRMLLFMLCSWKAVVTSVAVMHYLYGDENNVSQGAIVALVWTTLRTVILLSAAALNISMFKKLRKKDGLADSQLSRKGVPQANAQQTSIILSEKHLN